MAQITDAFELDGFVQQRKELEALLMSNPHMEKKVQGLIRKVLVQARRSVGEAAAKSMDSDPRQAYKAVKMAVYRQILGGNVSLYNKKRASNTGSRYEPQRTLVPGQRGGNRRPRSMRTEAMQSYMGSDRGFVLRFLENGTPGMRNLKRFQYDKNRKENKWNRHPNTGYRGHIRPRNFFSGSSQKAMQIAAQKLTELIDNLIQKENI